MSGKLALGVKVRDIVTGFEGTTTGHAKYLTGCDQYFVTAQSKKGKPAEGCWFDENSLEALKGEKKIVIKETSDKKVGGPSRGPARGGIKLT